MKKCSLILNASLLLLLAYTLLISSCNPVYYQPNLQNVLVLKEKKDLAIGGAANFKSSFSEGSYAYNVHGAYAFDKQFGVGFNTDAIKVDGTNSGGKGGLTEIGLCYFKAIDKGIYFSNYVWAGLGNVENHFNYHTGTDSAEVRSLDAKFSRFAIQPSISLKHKNIGITFSAKFSSNTYNKIDDRFGAPAKGKVSSGYLANHKNNIMFEPAITVKYGKEHFNIFVQYVYSNNLSYSDFPMENTALGLGLSYTFNLGPKHITTK